MDVLVGVAVVACGVPMALFLVFLAHKLAMQLTLMRWTRGRMKHETETVLVSCVLFLLAVGLWCAAFRVATGNFPCVMFFSDAAAFLSRSTNLRRDLPVAAELIAWNAFQMFDASAASGIAAAIRDEDISFRHLSRNTRFLHTTYRCLMNLAEYPARVVSQNATHVCVPLVSCDTTDSLHQSAVKCEAMTVGYLWHVVGTGLFPLAFLAGLV